MSVDKKHIATKANALIGTLNRQSAKEREQQPSGDFANDYNNLRKLALEIKPDLKDVFPPEVKVQTFQGRTTVFAHYIEILSYINQINDFLALGD